MRHIIGAVSALLLTGCGGSASNQSALVNGAAEIPASDQGIANGSGPSNETAATNAAAATNMNAGQGNAMTEPNADWAGRYVGDLEVDIRAGRRADSYRVDISTTSRGGCMGVVSGTGTVRGNRMSVVAVDEDVGPEAQCRIALSRSGGNLSIEEGDGCADFHGAMCSFDGTAVRQSR